MRSTVNGRDPAQVTTSYRVDVCPGEDFFTCDQTPQTWQSTGISGQGGAENGLLGSLDTTVVDPGTYTLRLTVNSEHTATGRSQILNDYYPITVQAIAVVPPADPAPDEPAPAADPAPGAPPADPVLASPPATLAPLPAINATSSASAGGGGCVLRQRAEGRSEQGYWSLMLLYLLLVVIRTARVTYEANSPWCFR